MPLGPERIVFLTARHGAAPAVASLASVVTVPERLEPWKRLSDSEPLA
jgi:hypothetical protein